jgi:hypothetical protein
VLAVRLYGQMEAHLCLSGEELKNERYLGGRPRRRNVGKIVLAFTSYSTLCCLSLGKLPTSHQLEQRGDRATPVKGVMQLGCLDGSAIGRWGLTAFLAKIDPCSRESS